MKCMKLFKRNKTWYVQFSRGKKKSLRTQDEKKARKLFNAMEKKFLAGRLQVLDEIDRITLDDYRELFIARRGDKSKDTLRMDSLALRTLADVLGGKTAIRTINKEKIDKFKAAQMARGLSKTSLNIYLRHIQKALNEAFEDGYLTKPVKVEQVKAGKPLPKILNPKERKDILEYAEGNDSDMHRIILFALWTGCRLSEILGVRWQDVNGEFCRVTGKGSKERIVPLLAGALEAMGEVKDVGPVFRQFHPNTVSHRFKDIAIACKVEARFHNLRHTAATVMLEAGIRLATIKKVLGHADIRTTEIYAKVLDEEMLAEFKEKMGK